MQVVRRVTTMLERFNIEKLIFAFLRNAMLCALNVCVAADICVPIVFVCVCVCVCVCCDLALCSGVLPDSKRHTCAILSVLNGSTVGSRFTTNHFYDPCRFGPNTADLWCITVATQASFLYLVLL